MSFLKKLFSREPEITAPPVTDYSSVGVDIHSHLIPGIDDGSKSLEESIELIRRYISLGFRKLITTPHVMSDSYRNTPEIISSGLEKLKEAVRAAGLEVTLGAAAEYYFDEDFSKIIREKNLLTIGGKYVLFEVSYMNPPDNIERIIFDIQVAGFVPLLAHPERYPFWYNKFETYYRLKEAGVMFQMNTNSLCGYYGPDAKKIAERMVNESLIDFIGSDMHGSRHMEALQRCLSEKYLWKLVDQGVKNASLL